MGCAPSIRLRRRPDVEGAPDERRSQRWRFDKRIGLGEVLTVLIVMGGIWAAAASMLKEVRDTNAATLIEMRAFNATTDKRLSILEEKSAMQQRVDAAQDASTHDGQARIEASLSEIQRYLREHTSPK